MQEEISEVKRKKQLATEACVKSLQKEAYRFSLEAEEKNEMQLLVKASSFRKTAKKTELVVDDLSKAIEKLEQEQTNV